MTNKVLLIIALVVLSSAYNLNIIGIKSAQAAGADCVTPKNAIVAENCLPGNPRAEWDIAGAGDPSIQGFATDISVNKGQSISFKVKTSASSYRLEIYRLGYYKGDGARIITTLAPTISLPQVQPNCLTEAVTGLIDCGNWSVSASWHVPETAISGVYIAKLVRSDTGGSSHIHFIVRDDAGRSDILFQTSDTTWQAYNDYGGNSLYTRNNPIPNSGRAYMVSYNRPLVTRGNQYARAFFFSAEYPMLRWLEVNGFNVSYFTGVDSTRNGLKLLEHKAFLSVGHDEYWSAAQRQNVTQARNQGVHLAFFSGNEMFWKTRWESSMDTSLTAYRTLVAYKETHANAKIDPLPDVWTGTWRDPRFSPPADGGLPENALTGTLISVNCCLDGLGINIPEISGKFRFWRNTSVARLLPGQTAVLPLGVLGYEWDEAPNNEFTPSGLIRLSSTPVNLSSQYLLNYGSSFGAGSATHNLTLYRHKSGALVFGAGTIRWPWGLDGQHDLDSVFPVANTIQPDIRMRQSTVNLLADMGIQPQSLQTDLKLASKTTDKIAPIAKIVSPKTGTTVYSCRPIDIRGTAADNVGGGKVASIEISTDNGKTWRLASGLNSWKYSWKPENLGLVRIRSRAVDDSGNIQTIPAITRLTVATGTGSCSLWDSATKPKTPVVNDPFPVELGLKFKSDVPGSIIGLRFYKGAANTGPHIGKLWSANGSLLASIAFGNETAEGWQQVNFTKPVKINANTLYVASYFAPSGNYSANSDYFTKKGEDRTPLHAFPNSIPGGNGVYTYGLGGFPVNSFSSANYWVDIVFYPDKKKPVK